MIGGEKILDVTEPFGDDVEDWTIRGRRDVLLEPRDAKVRLGPHGTAVGRLLAADHFEQRRLPRPVSAENRHTLARVDLQFHIVEQREMTEGQGKMRQ